MSVKPDVSRLAHALSGLADAYNAAKSLFDTYRDLNPAVSSHLATVVERLRTDLEQIGIAVGASGTLDVDTDEVADALTSHYGTVLRIIGEPRGLAPDLRSIADMVRKAHPQ